MGKSERKQNVQTLYNFVSSYGIKPIVDMVVRHGARVAKMEELVQACVLKDQDRWILSLPVALKLQDPPAFIGELDTLREPPSRIAVTPNSGDHNAGPSPVIYVPGGAVSSTGLSPTAQDVLRKFAANHADGDRVFPLLKRFFRRLVRFLLG